MKKENTINDAMVRPQHFGMAQHKFRQFDAVVPAGTTRDDIKNPKFWGLVAPHLQMGSEVRLLAEDFSFRAIALITYAQGTVIRAEVVQFTEFEIAQDQEENEDYKVVLRGTHRYCIVKRDTGEIVKSNLPTKVEAFKELEQFLQALAA